MRDRISIHAPRVGRDLPPQDLRRASSISIHAPRVGRDLDDEVVPVVAGAFQSTRPVWGATSLG